MLANSLIELDRAHLIHPVASYRGHETLGVRVLASAKGATVTDASGRQLVDGFAGLWCVNAGYGHDSIVEAAARQMRELPYATAYFDLGSEPAIRLAAELAERAPGDLNHVYFTLGGSDAVDSTVRFVRYYWNARGEPTTRPVHLHRAGLSRLVDGRRGPDRIARLPRRFRHSLRLAAQDSLPLSLSQPGGRGSANAIIAASLAALKAKIEEIGAGAGRCLLCRADPRLGRRHRPAERLDQGDARALPASTASCSSPTRSSPASAARGPLFACTEEDIVPDFMTTAKGLTSGYVPMGAVFMADHVYDVIADGAGNSAVGHGYTYSAHPVSAAVASKC